MWHASGEVGLQSACRSNLRSPCQGLDDLPAGPGLAAVVAPGLASPQRRFLRVPMRAGVVVEPAVRQFGDRGLASPHLRERLAGLPGLAAILTTTCEKFLVPQGGENRALESDDNVGMAYGFEERLDLHPGLAQKDIDRSLQRFFRSSERRGQTGPNDRDGKDFRVVF